MNKTIWTFWENNENNDNIIINKCIDYNNSFIIYNEKY
tara:strand:+ start:908 stop:1021 length:114 start_codon:yes stop_codon:yes gene_type:complete